MPPEPAHWPRHGWVRLGEGWAEHLRSPLAAAEHAEVGDWCSVGRPLVIARGRPGDAAGELRLGLATPDRRRIGLHVAAAAVAERLDPLPLAEAVDSAPAAWRPMLAELARRAQELGTAAAVYGSLAWQRRTGLCYVRPESDVDLLFAPSDQRQLDRLLDLLAETGDGIPRLDGEILLPDGAAVAWRELAGRPARLLVKEPAEVGLRDLVSVLALFDREDAA
ncbi:phosphoribosyl-dephospho-CoA transferase [Azospirillum lipoferum]|uniref:Malonate decarboxylase holo-[acyl-carrier-protein] synthase n=1 Tax=Azospirillum lipoferum TaxID=193 RepID=A0A5A9GSC1_AZOLI|nr:malonate decarboxylase holo-[acyl-carrier-protein] synthase [Azospirillum lipoferum]KAA0596229.1 malonate decarboxylase holo-[acyl-carrier-protein] synthase [Azospirillum lipoferum]MCP1611194.1 phosphoribosyl-dephospho-CoA transferase [Azospirillum lipoferum]